MWQLIVQGSEPRQRLRQQLENGRSYIVGRSEESDLPVIWEPLLSRRHVEITVDEDGIGLSVSNHGRNPIFVNGREIETESDAPIDKFVIGNTSFYLNRVSSSSSSADAPIQELTFTHAELRNVHFADADRRLEALARLPEVLSEAASKEESATPLTSMILAGIAYAEAAAIVALDSEDDIQIQAWERRTEIEGTFRPSVRLVRESLRNRKSVLHIWEKSHEGGHEYTMAAEFDWAFCVPIDIGEGRQWCIYVAGQLDSPFGESSQIRQNVQSDVRFAQLVGEVISSAQKMNRLEGQLSVLRRFLSPPILKALEETGHGHELNIDLLKPRECDVTVLFCDLRGFSHKAEGAIDNLSELLERVSMALEVMTREILDFGGVTGDFLGDAVLGFWGWPFSSENASLNACRAALAIRQEFSRIHQQAGHPLQDFQMGIGIAHGRAVAGQIGTSGRMAVTVFGPVVNVASRLEGMTRKLRVPIVMDDATSQLVRSRLAAEEGRVRNLAKVQPYGMETPILVSELLPPTGHDSELTDEQIATYEQGVANFVSGQWEDAYRLLHSMPSNDQAQDFLLATIAQHNRRAPANWAGVIELSSK